MIRLSLFEILNSYHTQIFNIIKVAVNGEVCVSIKYSYISIKSVSVTSLDWKGWGMKNLKKDKIIGVSSRNTNRWDLPTEEN